MFLAWRRSKSCDANQFSIVATSYGTVQVQGLSLPNQQSQQNANANGQAAGQTETTRVVRARAFQPFKGQMYRLGYESEDPDGSPVSQPKATSSKPVAPVPENTLLKVDHTHGGENTVQNVDGAVSGKRQQPIFATQ